MVSHKFRQILIFHYRLNFISSCFPFPEILDPPPVRSIIQLVEDVIFGWHVGDRSPGEGLPRYSQLLLDNILLRTAHSGYLRIEAHTLRIGERCK